MALSNGPKLGLLVDGAQGELHYEQLMARWRALDSLVQANVISRTLTAPPGSPTDGQTYIVGAAATGAWSTHDNKIARYSTKQTAWEFYTPQNGWRVYSVADAKDYRYNGSSWVEVAAGGGSNTVVIPIAVSDETTALTTGVAKVTFRMPFPMTLTGVRSSVTQAPTGANLVVDINENGTSILSTKLSIDATEKTSVTAATPPVISDTSLADDAEMTIDIDAVGSTVAGAGLKVYLIGAQA